MVSEVEINKQTSLSSLKGMAALVSTNSKVPDEVLPEAQVRNMNVKAHPAFHTSLTHCI